MLLLLLTSLHPFLRHHHRRHRASAAACCLPVADGARVDIRCKVIMRADLIDVRSGYAAAMADAVDGMPTKLNFRWQRGTGASGLHRPARSSARPPRAVRRPARHGPARPVRLTAACITRQPTRSGVTRADSDECGANSLGRRRRSRSSTSLIGSSLAEIYH